MRAHLDVTNAGAHVAEAPRDVRLQQIFEQVLELLREMAREAQLLSGERCLPTNRPVRCFSNTKAFTAK
jgi:hypothetical protein